MAFLIKSLLLSVFIFQGLFPSSSNALLCKNFLNPLSGVDFSFPKTQDKQNVLFYMSRTKKEAFDNLNLPDTLHFRAKEDSFLEVRGLPFLWIESVTNSSLIFRLPLGLRVHADIHKSFLRLNTLSGFKLLSNKAPDSSFSQRLKTDPFQNDHLTNKLLLEQSALQIKDSTTAQERPSLIDDFKSLQIKAFEVLTSLFKQKQPLTVTDLAQVNALILSGSNHRNPNVQRKDTGVMRGPTFKANLFIEDTETYFIPYVEVPKAMSLLISKINSLNKSSSLIDVAHLYQYFILIHPFIDGNGRTSRALLDYMLLKSGFPPLKHSKVTSHIIHYTPAELALIMSEAFNPVY